MATPGVPMVGVSDTSLCVIALHATVLLVIIQVNQFTRSDSYLIFIINLNRKSASWNSNAEEPL